MLSRAASWTNGTSIWEKDGDIRGSKNPFFCYHSHYSLQMQITWNLGMWITAFVVINLVRFMLHLRRSLALCCFYYYFLYKSLCGNSVVSPVSSVSLLHCAYAVVYAVLQEALKWVEWSYKLVRSFVRWQLCLIKSPHSTNSRVSLAPLLTCYHRIARPLPSPPIYIHIYNFLFYWLASIILVICVLFYPIPFFF